MKKLFYIGLGLMLLASCRHPEVEYVDFDTFHVLSVKSGDVVMADGTLNPEIRFMEDAELPESTEPETKAASTSAAAFIRDLLGDVKSNSLIHIVGTYSGHDVDGTPLTQSGKLLLPATGDIKNLILVSHYTIGANSECPSETFPMEGIFASQGYAVAIADYIGFGITAGQVHPYMHTRSTAQSVVDMALAVKPYLEHIGRKPLSDEVILAGYSQGGATTMAVMKTIQNDYYEEFPILKVYAGGGPYDLAATFDYSMEADKTGIPCAIPMIVQGINEGDKLGLKMSDFFQPRLLDNYQEWINSKRYTVKDINILMNAGSLHEIMTDAGRDRSSPETARLYKALMLNSLVNFNPMAPVYMFHSMDDGTVPFINAQSAESHFKGCNIHYDFDHYGSHAMGCIRFIYAVTKDLKTL